MRATAMQGTLQNNFPYRDAFTGGNVHLRNARFNSGFQRLVLGNTQGRLRSKFVLEHNTASRQLPSYSGAAGFGLQQDLNLRGMGELSLKGKNTWLGRYGIFGDRILYRAPGSVSTDTTRSVNQYVQLEWQRDLKFLQVSAGTDINAAKAWVPYYYGIKTRLAPALYAGLRLQARALALGGLLRYEGLENIFSSSLNGELSLSRNSSLLFNAGNSFRRPTMNDLYWGGSNPLNPEKGRNAELSFKIAHPGKIRWQAWLGAYHRDILQAIRWVPGNGGLWRPVNIDHLRCDGAQLWVNASRKCNDKLKLELALNYNFTHSMVLHPDGKTTPNMFVPKHAGNTQMSIHAGKWNAGINGIFNGYRYTSTDGSNYLPGYFLLNAWLECSFKICKKCSAILRYDAFNISAAEYQLMPNYPMPERNQQLKLIIKTI
jgi:outer membrane cobalamin receptor